MKSVYVASIITKDGDHYIFAYARKPTKLKVLKKYAKMYGEEIDEENKFMPYVDTLVDIEKVTIE